MQSALATGLIASATTLLLLLTSRAHAAIGFVDAGTIGSYGSGPGQLIDPSGIAVDDAGAIYVTDTYNRRINKFSPSGAFLLSWGSVGAGDGQFSFPNGIDVTSAGEVFVSDFSRRDVQVFTSNGVFLRKFGAEVFSGPTGLFASDDDTVYVADHQQRLVHRFSFAGSHLGTWGPSFVGGSFTEPRGVEGREPSQMLVSDGVGVVHQLSTGGDYQRALGAGQITSTTGAAVIGNLLIATDYSRKVVRLIDTRTGTVESVLGDDEPYSFERPLDAAVQGDSIALILDDSHLPIRRLRIVEGTPPSVLVTSPPTGAAYMIGQEVPIDWTTTDDGSVTSIDLTISFDGGTFTRIATGIPNTGSYSWIATGRGAGSCRIRVTARDNLGLTANGYNPGAFRIRPLAPQVTVLSPSGGESFSVGSTIEFSWSVRGELPEWTDVLLSKDGGATWGLVGWMGGSDSSLVWLGWEPPSSKCKLRVVVGTASGVIDSDDSDSTFTIIGPPGIPWAFAGKFGSTGADLGLLSNPQGIAAGDDGRVYIADTFNSRVQWFDRNGIALGEFGGSDLTGGLNMQRPRGIDVDALGHVYVTDLATRLVKKFTADGGYLGLIGDSSSFQEPHGLWVSDEGTVYVTDRSARRVRLFSATTGALTGEWGPSIGGAVLEYPQSIEGDGRGLLYVMDGSGVGRIRTLDGVGQQIHEQRAPRAGSAAGAALAGSHLYVPEYNQTRLSVVSVITRVMLDVLGDDEPFRLNWPLDAATMGDSMLYVLCSGDNQVVRMRLPMLTPPSVQLLQPNGGERLPHPSSSLIAWNATDDVDVVSVDVLVSRDSGLSWSVIATGLPNSGTYEWAVSGAASEHCLVRVIARDASGGVGTDRSDLEFAIVGQPVPTLLVSLSAEEHPDGIAVQWQLADAQLLADSRLQRSLARDGAYTFVEGVAEMRAEGARLMDHDVEPGHTYWYRVVAGDQRFGPIAVESGVGVQELAFTPARPNPTEGQTRLSFALPRAAGVRLTVHDISGREVAELVSGERVAGRHEVMWSGEGARGRVVPGLYFARLAVRGEAARVRRLVVTR